MLKDKIIYIYSIKKSLQKKLKLVMKFIDGCIFVSTVVLSTNFFDQFWYFNYCQ